MLIATPKGPVRRRSGNPQGRQQYAVGSTPFGDRLKKARAEKGLTASMLADQLGTCHSKITGFENRGVKPRFDTLMALCATLDCSLEWLCEGELKAAYKTVDKNRGIQSE